MGKTRLLLDLSAVDVELDQEDREVFDLVRASHDRAVALEARCLVETKAEELVLIDRPRELPAWLWRVVTGAFLLASAAVACLVLGVLLSVLSVPSSPHFWPVIILLGLAGGIITMIDIARKRG